jgi:CRP/FNR family transcriptional regulator, cyclic AMP receptor protein
MKDRETPKRIADQIDYRRLDGDMASLTRSPLFSGLSRNIVECLNNCCIWRTIKAGAFVCGQELGSGHLFVVTKGCVRAVRMINGRAVILRDVFAGDYIEEFSEVGTDAGAISIVAITDAVVARMPSKIFRQIIHQYPKVCDRVLSDFACRIRALNDRLSDQVRLNARERLCSELLRLSRQTAPDRIVVSPPPRHSDLAGRIGGSRETITKLLTALERDGLISRNRTAILLKDVPQLRMIAAAF